jgi:heme/copper-type cytochrome/quinol oxidase subunit 1
MPRLSRWYLRAALSYLVLGFTFGGLLLAHKGVNLHPAYWRLLPGHIEAVLVGWTLQLVFGVTYWILPRFRGARRRERLAWFSWATLNAGLLLVEVAIWLPLSAPLAGAGRAVELVGAGAFLLHAWPRIKPLGG